MDEVEEVERLNEIVLGNKPTRMRKPKIQYQEIPENYMV